MTKLSTDRLGNGGRLGNNLFAYASLIGLADRYGHELSLPEWKYSEYFDYSYPRGETTGEVYQEKHFHYDEYLPIGQNKNFCVKGYFQSEKYWKNSEKKVRKALTFKPGFVKQAMQGLDHAFRKNVIAMHVRRGDYLGNPNYHNLPVSYYIQALFEHFPDWREQSNILVFSDDIEYCKVHFRCLPNVYFSQGNEIEDLCRMTMCDDFIISNSSFSWFGAYLGKKKSSTVVRPTDHFEGHLKATCDIGDLYPSDWISFRPAKKMDLTDVTFTIPVFMDHTDRKYNLDLSVCMLQHYFDTDIMVMENKSCFFGYMAKHTMYFQTNHGAFHRTRMLNDMAKMANTAIVANWDADVIVPPMQIWNAVQAIRKGADMVYPYDGTFARVPRVPWFKSLEKTMDIGIVRNTTFQGMGLNDKHSVGGAVLWNRKRFLEAGGENEKFISFGAEDTERFIRAQTLGYAVKRVDGPLYHINHYVGVNSSTRNPYFHQNRQEFEKVSRMSKKELKNYIKTWNT